MNKYQLSNIELVPTHMILELDVFIIFGKLLVSITLYQKNSKKIQNLILRGCPKTNRPKWLIGTLEII